VSSKDREERAIVIVDYDEEWPQSFDVLAQIIRSVGGERGLSVGHIGSTVVPGLAAKPMIDILLSVQDVADEAGYVPSFESAGFALRVREPGHRMLRTQLKDVHLHVFSPETEAVPKYRDLRDGPRVDETDRALYADTKRDARRRQLHPFGQLWKDSYPSRGSNHPHSRSAPSK
jgi:GrpB-like predicted nucleotidyltransferase (UPF0157 family)